MCWMCLIVSQLLAETMSGCRVVFVGEMLDIL